eukprot:comp17712_c0_seq1/m.17616 comp17712_c0_seq1/g.17616  ORF comp17712_c0_seq1/g.17616 comp17712_c0_seq1/m.17616 type:complete len:901 (-) comp17712_c0_seq1:60-2762(-)
MAAVLFGAPRAAFAAPVGMDDNVDSDGEAHMEVGSPHREPEDKWEQRGLHDEVEIAFSEILSSYESQGDADVYHLCERMHEVLQQVLNEVAANPGRYAVDEETVGAWRHERNTWELCKELIGYRKGQYVPERTANLKLVDLWKEDYAIQRALFAGTAIEDCAHISNTIRTWCQPYRYLDVIKQWLERIAAADSEAEKTDTYRDDKFFTKRVYYENSLNRRPANGKFELDPDAATRPGSKGAPSELDYYDKEAETELWREVYRLVRCGQWDRATELCGKAGHSWFAAVLYSADAYGRIDTDDATVPTMTGNMNRAVWKECCQRMADNKDENVHLRALCALFAAGMNFVSNPAYMSMVSPTFEDRLWVACFIAQQNIMQNVVNLVEEAYGPSNGDPGVGPYRTHLRGPSTFPVSDLPTNIEALVVSLLDAARAIDPSTVLGRAEADNIYHQVQAYLIRYADPTIPTPKMADVLINLVPAPTGNNTSAPETMALVERHGLAPSDARLRNRLRFLSHYAIVMEQHVEDVGAAYPSCQQAVVSYVDYMAPDTPQPGRIDMRTRVAVYCAMLEPQLRITRYGQFIASLLSIPPESKNPAAPAAATISEYGYSLLESVFEKAQAAGIDLQACLLHACALMGSKLASLHTRKQQSASRLAASEQLARGAGNRVREGVRKEVEEVQREVREAGEQAGVCAVLLGHVSLDAGERLGACAALFRGLLMLDAVQEGNLLLQAALDSPGLFADMTSERIETKALAIELNYYRDYVETFESCRELQVRLARLSYNDVDNRAATGELTDLLRTIQRVMLESVHVDDMSDSTLSDWVTLRCRHLPTWCDWLVQVCTHLQQPSVALATTSQCLADPGIGFCQYLDRDPRTVAAMLQKCMASSLQNLNMHGDSFWQPA